MLFEVYKGNTRVFWTTSEKCVPDEALLAHIKKAGYKAKISNTAEDGLAKKKPAQKKAVEKGV